MCEAEMPDIIPGRVLPDMLVADAIRRIRAIPARSFRTSRFPGRNGRGSNHARQAGGAQSYI